MKKLKTRHSCKGETPSMKEAIGYFQGGKGFRRLFVLFKKKYESLGRVGGTVTLTGWTDEELADIALFFGLSVSELKRKRKVALEQFEQQLKRTKFEQDRKSTRLNS